MKDLFTYSVLPGTRIMRIHSQGRTDTNIAEAAAALPEQLQRMYAWVKDRFGDRPFRQLVILEGMGLVLRDQDATMAQASFSMFRSLNAERSAYVIDSATMRMQFRSLFREAKLADTFRVFDTEPEALAFLNTK
jgi:hypothetical protein